MPLSFVYWGLIVVAAGGLLIPWITKADLLVKALVSVIGGALIGLQILAMRLPFRIAAGLPLPRPRSRTARRPPAGEHPSPAPRQAWQGKDPDAESTGRSGLA